MLTIRKIVPTYSILEVIPNLNIDSILYILFQLNYVKPYIDGEYYSIN
jgi:hypothetical protein